VPVYLKIQHFGRCFRHTAIIRQCTYNIVKKRFVVTIVAWKRRTQRDIVINVHRPSYKVAVFLVGIC
jgi:hypothetical protein